MPRKSRATTTIQDIKNFANSKGGILLDNDEYYTYRKKYTFRCKEGHEFPSRWDGISHTRWCGKCCNKKYYQEDLERICEEKKIKFLSDKFENSYTSYNWRCHLGHIFTTDLGSIIRPEFNHCKKCSKMKYNIEDVKEECKKRNIECLEDIYKGSKYPMKFKLSDGELITLTYQQLQRKCIKCSTTRATYNVRGEKPKYCNSCKSFNMFDVRSKMCGSCGLFRSIKKYNHLCITCFMFQNPDHIITTKYRKKENQVVSKLKEEFKDYTLICDKQTGGCSKYRPDVLIDLYTHCIIIEIDEDQHKNYTCEEARTNQLFTDLGDRQLIIIRFNPDKYKDENNKVIRGIFSFDKENNIKIYSKKEYNIRMTKLIETVKENIPYKKDDLFKEFTLFYNVK